MLLERWVIGREWTDPWYHHSNLNPGRYRYNPRHPCPNHCLRGRIRHINPTRCGKNHIKPVYQYICRRNLHDIFAGLIVDKVNHHQNYFLLPIQIPLSSLLVVAILGSIMLLIPEDPHVLR